jgi:hypothetical protein
MYTEACDIANVIVFSQFIPHLMTDWASSELRDTIEGSSASPPKRREQLSAAIMTLRIPGHLICSRGCIVVARPVASNAQPCDGDWAYPVDLQLLEDFNLRN